MNAVSSASLGLIDLKCLNCASPLPEGTWDRKHGVANCGYCGSVVALPLKFRNFRPRLRVPMPPGIRVFHDDGGLLITHRWLSIGGLGGIALAAMTMAIYHAPDRSGVAMSETPGLNLGCVLLGLLCFASAYYGLAHLINRSWIRIRNGALSIHHGPLPWWGTRFMPCCEVDQCFSRSRIVQMKNGTREYFELWVASTNGTSSKLLSTAALTLDQVLFLEQQIEQALGIEDRPMAGEISRGII